MRSRWRSWVLPAGGGGAQRLGELCRVCGGGGGVICNRSRFCFAIINHRTTDPAPKTTPINAADVRICCCGGMRPSCRKPRLQRHHRRKRPCALITMRRRLNPGMVLLCVESGRRCASWKLRAAPRRDDFAACEATMSSRRARVVHVPDLFFVAEIAAASVRCEPTTRAPTCTSRSRCASTRGPPRTCGRGSSTTPSRARRRGGAAEQVGVDQLGRWRAVPRAARRARRRRGSRRRGRVSPRAARRRRTRRTPS